MSDNIRFDDDYFADNEPKEREPKERMTKDASKKKGDLSPETLMKIIIAAVAVGAVIIIVLARLVNSSFSDNDNKDDGETTTISSVEGENTVGTYTVTISESPSASLNLREQASMEASSLTKIPNGEHLLVSDVVAADGITWGKVSYKNFTGYVDMKYLVKSYTGTVPSVPEVTTNAPEGTSAEEPEAEVTTKPAETTKKAAGETTTKKAAAEATTKKGEVATSQITTTEVVEPTTETMGNVNGEKCNKFPWWILIILLLLVIAVVVYYYYKKKRNVE